MYQKFRKLRSNFRQSRRHKRNKRKKLLKFEGVTKLNILKTFPLFAPGGDGNYKMWEPFAILAINETLPLLASLVRDEHYKILTVDEFVISDKSEASELGDIFARMGSDKSTTHDYYRVYFKILNEVRENELKLFEIGLGTNNTDVISNMGSTGRPGASLRAFKEFLPNSSIFGADIDQRILFTEERIQTFYVDQTEQKTFEELDLNIGKDFYLMIEDGLHVSNANLRSFAFFMTHVQHGGWIIIEDIGEAALSVWKCVSSILRDRFDCYVIKTKSAYMFCARKL